MARHRGPASAPVVRGADRLTLASLARALVDSLAGLTFYAAPSLSFGALAVVLSKPLGLDLATAFAAGFFVPVGPVYLVYASGWGMRRTLTQIKAWEEAGLIDHPRAEKLRDKAVAWFIARRF